MKVILVNGSPHENGCTHRALKEVETALNAQGIETENGHIKVDREMATNLVGCYAAGDCTGRPYQYAKAVGEGNIAAHSVTAFLAKV